MPTLFEQYAKYRYQQTEGDLEELAEEAEKQKDLDRDLDRMEAYRQEQAQREKEGKPKEEKDESEMTPEEKETKEWLHRNRKLARWSMGNRQGYISADGAYSPYMVQQVRMRHVFRDSFDMMSKWGYAFPEDEDVCEKFPAMDPMGSYCEVDLGFRDRISKIEAAAKTRPEEIQKYVEQTVNDWNSPDKKVSRAWDRVREAAQKVACNTRAAKRAVTQEDSDWFLEERQGLIDKSMYFQRFDRLLNVMEYAVGISNRAPSKEEIETAKELEVPFTPTLEALRDAPVRVPDEIKVEFQDFSHKMEQLQYCNPENWGKRSRNVPKDAPSAEAAEHYMEKYVEATADRYISPLFAQVENATEGIVNRGDLIIVGGKTVSEVMEEKYRQGIGDGTIGSNVSQKKWYEQNLKRMTGEIVSAGLMAGKRVEAFVPDKEGRLPKEPIGITKTGYEPSPLEKVTLNAWERHFARHGYYKEKAAKAVDYQQTMDARERVQVRNAQSRIEANRLSGNKMKGLFFGEWMKENGPLPTEVPGGFSAGRSIFPTMAICAMVNKGYSLEDVLDPDKLTEQRNAVGKEVIERMSAGDKKWEADVFLRGGNALAKEFDRIASGIDYTNEKELFSDKGKPLFAAAKALMDVRQEMRRGSISEEMLQAAEAANPGKGKEELEKLDNLGKGLALYLNGAQNSLQSRVHFGTNVHGDMMNIACFEAMKNIMAEKRAANPGKPQMELFGIMEMGCMSAVIANNESFNNFSNTAATKPEYIQVLANKALTGELGRSMKVSVDAAKLTAEFGIDVKYNQKREKKDERIREIVGENAAKDARKQRDKEREALQKAKEAQSKKKAAPKQAPKSPARGH